ncbi:unnamed protein product [Ilex paraguariensis]|uniref:Uncharacterized protein n=1 Tax=Ilex paraguariensis TaxID=185542 RepID=A0ABC8SKN7_9AQUA
MFTPFWFPLVHLSHEASDKRAAKQLSDGIKFLRVLSFSTMGLDARVFELSNKYKTHRAWAISMHTFSDLSRVSPLVFLYLLRECYAYGTCKATRKFRSLQQQIHQVLYNAPQPGPAVFVARCLYILPIFESYCEGFSHLILSALCRFLKRGTTPEEDLFEAKILAVQLFLGIVGGSILHDERILIKILEVFDVGLVNIEKVMCNSDVKNGNIEKVMCNSDVKNSSSLDASKAFIEQYIFVLLESQSYMTAVTLLEHFSIRESGESFLLIMMESKQYRAAEKWATFMGRPILCVLVQEYIDRNLLKHAYEIIKKNNLRKEFPEVYHKGKESSLKKLAEKGCWGVAEARTNSDRQLLEYLVGIFLYEQLLTFFHFFVYLEYAFYILMLSPWRFADQVFGVNEILLFLNSLLNLDLV